MSVATMSRTGAVSAERVAPTWWVVFTREVTDLWVGGKGLTLVLVYSLLLGLWSFVMASNTELKLIPPKEMVWEMLEATICVGCFICMIAAADNISGDRERAALEGLLLTPTSRRQLVLGKYLAVLSVWPAVLLVTIPYLAVLSQGTDILPAAAAWGSLTGTVLVTAVTALGMMISMSSNTLKNGMFVTLGLFILIFMPFALPGHAQTGPMGYLLQLLSPLMATFDFLAKVLVNNRSIFDSAHHGGDMRVWHHLISPIFFCIVMVTTLVVSSSGLQLEAGTPRWIKAIQKRFFVILGTLCLGGALAAAPADAQEASQAVAPGEAHEVIEIGIDRAYAQVTQGDSIPYTTVITNRGQHDSPALTVAMNIINLNEKGDVVDPEDWSRRRTQYVDRVGPGQSITLNWTVNAIMDGDYMLYMVVIPRPDRPDATTQPATSNGVHLTVAPSVKLNPKGILLYVIGTPLLLILGMVYLQRRRRQATGEVATAD